MKAIALRPEANNTKGKVYLTPTNEGHELPVCDRFTGTQPEIIERSLTILTGLEALFPQGSWMVKIESANASECIYLGKENIYDADFKVIRKLKKMKTIFLVRNF